MIMRTRTRTRIMMIILSFVSPVLSYSPYLKSLSSMTPPPSSSSSSSSSSSAEEEHNFGMPEEEYYGCTNPMANNWPGSKHEQYGNYLTNLKRNDQMEANRNTNGNTNTNTNTNGSTMGYLGGLGRQGTDSQDGGQP